MVRKSIINIIEEIKEILQREEELSVRQISLKIGSQWRTINKALQLMKSLGIVKERENEETERDDRLFSLVNSNTNHQKIL